MTAAEWLAAIPGVVSIFAMLVGYGALLNRVKNVEADMLNVQREIDELRTVATLVARIDERTLATSEQGNRMERKLDGALVAHALTEPRSFRERDPTGRG
jgi:hypothetical protein